jgi:hypothetical protein
MALTPKQVAATQKAQAERDTAAVKAVVAKTALPATTTNGGAVAMPSNRQDYLNEIAPASIVGRMVKFSKDGKFITPDDDAVIGEGTDFVALCDQTLVGWIKFNGTGNPPDRVMGLLYDNFLMPARETLGDHDQVKWDMGLDGRPSDPWQHHIYLPLQRSDTGELFTYVTSSITGRRAIGNLLRHYDRTQKTHPDTYPIIKLKVGGFQHRDDRVGWVATPVLAVVGRAPKDSAAKPDSSLAADVNDQIPFN